MSLKNWIAGSMFALAATGGAAEEMRGPVVVELYTSQGCSACPPADELLRALAERDDVIALALHVDYWDYIGWKDVFARAEHAERQRGFAARVGKTMVYTPQMIIDGTAHVVGNKPVDVSNLVMKHAETADPVQVALRRSGDRLTIEAAGTVGGRVDIHMVRFNREQTVEITRGENRGRTISYANVVEDWSVIGHWDGASPLMLEADVTGDAPLAVLIQEPEFGPIFGAAILQ